MEIEKYCPSCFAELEYDSESSSYFCSGCQKSYMDSTDYDIDEYDKLADERAEKQFQEANKDLPF